MCDAVDATADAAPAAATATASCGWPKFAA